MKKRILVFALMMILIQVTPNSGYYMQDSYFEYQWFLREPAFFEAWAMLENNPHKVKLAVIDSGLDYWHEDMNISLSKYSYDFRNKDEDVMDIDGHGTQVISMICANRNNQKGTSGMISGQNMDLMVLKAYDYVDQVEREDVIEALAYAIEKGADIINISLGSDFPWEKESALLKEAEEKGILVIASMGNEGAHKPKYPASYDTVLSVGALSPQGQVSFFSNYHETLDVVAPGEDILTLSLDNQYRLVQGTSYAAAYVTGLSVMLKCLNPKLTAKEMRDILIHTAHKKEGLAYGKGILCPKEALEMAMVSAQTIYPLQRMNFEASEIFLIEGEIHQPFVSLMPERTNQRDISFHIADERIATVNDFGKIRALKKGRTVLLAQREQKKARLNLVVLERAKALGGPFEIDSKHTFRVSFNQGLSPKNDWTSCVYLLDKHREKIPIEVECLPGGRALEVRPCKNLREEESYLLYVGSGIRGEKGEESQNAYYKIFQVQEDYLADFYLEATPDKEGNMLLYWSPLSDAKGYFLYRSKNYQGPYQPFKDKDGQRKSFGWIPYVCVKHVGLPEGATVFYRVEASQDEGYKKSNIAYGTTDTSLALKIAQAYKYRAEDKIPFSEILEEHMIQTTWRTYGAMDSTQVSFTGILLLAEIPHEIQVDFKIIDGQVTQVRFSEKGIYLSSSEERWLLYRLYEGD